MTVENRYKKNPRYTECSRYTGSAINNVITVEARATRIMHMVQSTLPNMITFRRMAKLVKIIDRFEDIQKGSE